MGDAQVKRAQINRMNGAGAPRGSPFEVLKVATRLGLTSFGGPIAHLGYFHDEYVTRRAWLDDATYADLVALCQFLPGPASSEMGIAVGIQRAGLLGGFMAWLGFTFPSAIALLVFAFVVRSGGVINTPWLHALQLVAVAVVAQAVWQMAQRLAPDRPRGAIALLASAAVLSRPAGWMQVLVIVLAAVVGWRLLTGEPPSAEAMPLAGVSRRLGIAALLVLAACLVGLPLLQQISGSRPLTVFDAFFRSGALVFGGGHVVLPLLQAAVVAPGWVTNAQFLAGYGAAQAVPGPLFTFAAYLGAVMHPTPNGVPGAALALSAIFLPAFLLVIGVLPFWDMVRSRPGFRSALAGVNAAVVGLLLAALYQPIWTTSVRRTSDVVLALLAFGLLTLWRAPPWIVVLFSCAAAVIGQAVGWTL